LLVWGLALVGALVGVTSAQAAGPPICPTQWKETSSFEPTQGVWQDDFGTYSFADRAGMRLTRTETPLAPGEFPHTLATAELPMVQNRPTLIFGTQRYGGDRLKITLTATTSGTSDVAAFVRFKLSENAGPQRVVYESPVGSLAIGWGSDPSNPCAADKHDVTFSVPTPTGIPDTADPFQLTATGKYRITAVVVIKSPDGSSFEFQQIKTAVDGTVVATNPPRFDLIPATLTHPAPDDAAQKTLKKQADDLASAIKAKFATYMPLPVGPQNAIAASAGPYQDLDLTSNFTSLPFFTAFRERVTKQLGLPPKKTLGSAELQTLIDDLGLFTRYVSNVLDRTIVVVRPEDFKAAGVPESWQAFSASRKVIFVKDDSSQYTVGHEFSHTLCSGTAPACTDGYLWSNVQMLAGCNQSKLVAGPGHPSNAYHNDLPAHDWAHGYQLFNAVNAAGMPHFSRALIDLPSLLQSTNETQAQWLDQCAYANDLKQLQKIPDPRVILVSGLVAQRGKRAVGALASAYELNSQVDLTAHSGGPWAIVLRGRHHRVLGRFPFTPAFSYDDPTVKRIVAAIQYSVPAIPGVTAVELNGPGGKLDRLNFSTRAPRIRLRERVVHTPGGRHEKIVKASWSGAASSGHSLLYTLIESVDAGKTWRPLFFERAVRFITLGVAGGSSVVLKLIATDGSRSATAQRTVAVGP
jgi:hypothetical protein